MIPKIKAWDKIFECMVTPTGLELQDGKVIHVIEELPGEITKSSISDFELLQSTGLFDKNGKEIFEGDILSISKNHSKIDSGFFSDEKINYEVVFLTYDDMEAYADIEHYGWCAICLFTRTRSTLIDAVSLWDAEIIGSKFTHPHLLEEE